MTKLVDPLPYVDSVQNATVTAGGADKESDESYRERIHEAPESFSDAGSYGAYTFFAKSANPDIADVFITSPSPGEVKIVPLMTGGEIPEEEVLKDVLEACNDKTVRPLTDQVSVQAPTVKNMIFRLLITSEKIVKVFLQPSSRPSRKRSINTLNGRRRSWAETSIRRS